MQINVLFNLFIELSSSIIHVTTSNFVSIINLNSSVFDMILLIFISGALSAFYRSDPFSYVQTAEYMPTTRMYRLLLDHSRYKKRRNGPLESIGSDF